MTWKVPLFTTEFGSDEVSAVSDVVRSGWLTMGEKVLEFETAFAKKHNVRHAIAVNNCTAALHLANIALGAGPGDEVVCPSLTFVATANAIRYTNAAPVFADIHSPDNWNISVPTIEKCITEQSKGIVVVHYAGFPCDMSAVKVFAEKNNLFIIEDCAHAPGIYYKEKALGTWGDIGCFSFFSNKNLSTGEGGMLITDNDEIAGKLKLLRGHAMTTATLDRHKGHAFSYDVTDTGYNYRPTEITAALGIVQLNKLDLNNKLRRKHVQFYRDCISTENVNVQIPFSLFSLDSASAHIMPVLLPEKIDRKVVMALMKCCGSGET